MFGAVKLVTNADIDKYKCSGYGIGFGRRGTFSVGNRFCKNLMIFGADMSSSVHVDNKKKDILILGECPTQGLDDTILTAEKKYSIDSRKKFCLSLHYYGGNGYSFVNGIKIIKFKAKDSEIKPIPLCLGNISKDFSVDNIEKTGLNGYVFEFSVDYGVNTLDDILQ